MNLQKLRKIFRILIFLLLLSGLGTTVYATTLTPANGTNFTAANQFLSYTSTNLRAGGCILLPATYTWSSSGLPAGLSLSSTTGTNNTFSGTPTVSGTSAFTVTVTGRNAFGFSCGGSVTNTYYITVNPRCRFSGGSTGSISFTIDPTLTGPIYNTVTQNVNFQCGPGTTYSYSILPAQPNLTGTRNTIPYTLSAGQGLSPLGQNTSDGTLIPLLTTLSRVSNYQNAYAETDNSTETVTISWTGAAAGSIAATINAVGTVINACSVTGSPSLNFGTLDAASNAGGATATAIAPTIMCTMGDAISVTNNGGLNYSGTPRMKSGSNYLNYNFISAGSMTGAGRTTNIGGSGTGNLNLGATISAGALDNVPAGTYSDTVILTINY
ncbi:fibronectin type iii domain protein [hydrocarbon metagenome]|uniref:Fibronectin type iii domain protein n=1 Tax=hydrocarbon metagenome TaxID=938273 RepID=A0A0W8FRI7_9ZZZZ